VVLGASVANEIFLFIITSLLLSFADAGQVSLSLFFLVLGKIILFFLGVIFLGHIFLPLCTKSFNTVGRKGFTFAIIVSLLFGLLAEWIGLHIILGAYFAGMYIRKEVVNPKMFAKIEDRFYGLAHSFLGPIFFASVGMTISFGIFSHAPLLLLSLFFIVLLGQTLGSALMARTSRRISLIQSAQIGVGMLGRGGTEIIVAGAGFSAGILPLDLFSILVGVVFLCTLCMPIFFLFLQRKGEEKHH